MKFRFLLISMLCFLSGCGSEDGEESTPYGLRVDLRRDSPPQRTWVQLNVEHASTLSSSSDYTLFNPAELWILDDERVYVWDAGDNKLKAFTPGGTYVTAYGKGMGNGPGQVKVYRNVGLQEDSLYVFDPQNRRVSFFERSGGFGRSEQYHDPLAHLTWADDLTKYELYMGPGTPPSMDIARPAGAQTTVSDLLAREVSSMVFAGFLHATEERAVYVPYYYPLLLSFSPGDTIATAYPTPDYGEAPVPEPRRKGSRGQEIIRPPSSRVNWYSTIDGGVLSVQQDTPKDSLAFDLYDVRNMKYMHSTRLPIAGAPARYAHGAGLLAVEQDTTVELYEVERSEP